MLDEDVEFGSDVGLAVPTPRDEPPPPPVEEDDAGKSDESREPDAQGATAENLESESVAKEKDNEVEPSKEAVAEKESAAHAEKQDTAEPTKKPAEHKEGKLDDDKKGSSTVADIFKLYVNVT